MIVSLDKGKTDPKNLRRCWWDFLVASFNREQNVFISYKDFPDKHKLKRRGENGKE